MGSYIRHRQWTRYQDGLNPPIIKDVEEIWVDGQRIRLRAHSSGQGIASDLWQRTSARVQQLRAKRDPLTGEEVIDANFRVLNDPAQPAGPVSAPELLKGLGKNLEKKAQQTRSWMQKTGKKLQKAAKAAWNELSQD